MLHAWPLGVIQLLPRAKKKKEKKKKKTEERVRVWLVGGSIWPRGGFGHPRRPPPRAKEREREREREREG
jgi:hypothetical protein